MPVLHLAKYGSHPAWIRITTSSEHKAGSHPQALLCITSKLKKNKVEIFIVSMSSEGKGESGLLLPSGGTH